MKTSTYIKYKKMIDTLTKYGLKKDHRFEFNLGPHTILISPDQTWWTAYQNDTIKEQDWGHKSLDQYLQRTIINTQELTDQLIKNAEDSSYLITGDKSYPYINGYLQSSIDCLLRNLELTTEQLIKAKEYLTTANEFINK